MSLRAMLCCVLVWLLVGSAAHANPEFEGRLSGDRGSGGNLDQGGENIAQAYAIPALPFNDTGHTTYMFNDYYETCEPSDMNRAGDVVYSYYAASTQRVDIRLCGSAFNTKLYVYRDVHTPGNPYACDDDGCGIASQLPNLTLIGGSTYYIVVDGHSVSEGGYVISVIPRAVEPCPCPFPEQEPNDIFPPVQTIQPGQPFCGMLETPQDTDLVRLNVPQETAIRLTLHGNGATGTCPAGQGLHACIGILDEDGKLVAFVGDTLDVATEFSSDFTLGGHPYILKIVGARGTSGPYELQVDLLTLPGVPPPQPRVTLAPEGSRVRLRWNASYFADEQIEIDVASTPAGPFTTVAVLPGDQTSYLYAGTPTTAFFEVRAVGERPRDPYVGSVISLGDAGTEPGTGEEVADFLIHELEWGINLDNEVVVTYMKAEGLGPDAGQWIDQDNRFAYGQGVWPIRSFTGHRMGIFGRQVLVDHIAFVRDPERGDVGIINGRGTNLAGDTTMLFGDQIGFLRPNNNGVNVPWPGWFDGIIWDLCPGQCCILKSIAFCRSTGLAWNIACAGPTCPGNLLCWLGCPCPPVAGPNCMPPEPGCSPCIMRADPPFRVWCICPAQAAPPVVPMCFWQIWIKCKRFECPQFPVPCVCASGAVCPGPAVWTRVPILNNAVRDACERDCN